MPDFDAIATAVAARYAPAQVVPPAGLQNVRVATADLPNKLGPFPMVLVFTDQGALDGGHQTRIGLAVLLVRFYYEVTKDLPRELNGCRKWLTVLVDQHRTAMQLGGTVVSVRTRSWRIGTLPFGGIDHTGIELRVEVQTTEAWSPTP